MSPKPKNQSRLTESLEDYLEAIAELTAIEGHAHTKEIAKKLDVKMPSVTAAIRQLKELDYIIYKRNCPVVLTPEGQAIADDVIHRHKILKEFFSELLGLSNDKASDTACRLEHVVDADTIRRFLVFLEAIEYRCDAEKLRVFLSEAMSLLATEDGYDLRPLSNCKSGETVTIEKFGRNLGETDRPAFAIGDVITIDGASLDRSELRLTNKTQSFKMPISIAENIWVRQFQEKKKK